MPTSSRWSLSFRFPHQNSGFISLLPTPCHMPQKFHAPSFMTVIMSWQLRIMQLSNMYFSSTSIVRKNTVKLSGIQPHSLLLYDCYRQRHLCSLHRQHTVLWPHRQLGAHSCTVLCCTLCHLPQICQTITIL
jgi:hypothetical protein